METEPQLSADQPPLAKHGHRFVAIYLLILLAAASIGGIYSWQHQKVKDLNKQVASLRSQMGLPKLSKSNLATRQAQYLIEQSVPNGWGVKNNNGDNLVLENSQGTCFVNFYKYNEPTALASNPTAIYKAEDAITLKSTKDKGYTVTQLPASTLTVKTVIDGQKALTTSEFSATGPQTLRQSYAYYVQDGYYIMVLRSCNSAADLPTTDKALLAVLLF